MYWAFYISMSTDKDINNKDFLDEVFLANGQEVYTYEYIESLRNNKEARKKNIIPNAGSQEKALTCESNLLIYTGLRGVGKTGFLCMAAYDSIEHPSFSGMILRKEINDAKNSGGVADTSKKFYSDFGRFLESAQNMTWKFKALGSLKFDYYSDSYQSFVDRLRGRESSRISIDEITQMKFNYFRFLFTNNRNSHGLINQIVGTCNPDGDSWVYNFIGGTYLPDKNGKPRRKWLDENGKPIVEMDGVELYFYIYGDRADQIYWGETKEEVVAQAEREMIEICKNDPNTWEDYQNGKINLGERFVLSCTFFTGYTSENKLIDSDDYIKRIAALSPEERDRDLGGRWIRRSSSNTLIDMDDMDRFYTNAYQTDSYRCVTADISLGGKESSDPSVFYLWEGFHLAAVEICKVGAETLKAYIEQYLTKWGVSENDFCFDATGIGGGICERFADSMQFDARAKAFDYRDIQVGKIKQTISSYENIKAQCIDNFARRIKNNGYSIDTDLLYSKYDGKMLIDHFNEEYVSIARDHKKDGKFKAIDKKEVISIIGHSPDFFDAMYIREYVELARENNKRKARRKGVYFL